MEAGEGYHVYSELAQVTVKLTREAEGARCARDGSGD